MSDLVIEATHHQLRLLRPWLEAQVPTSDATLLGRIELCIHELASNVVDHSEADELTVRASASQTEIHVEVCDRGIPVALPAPGELESHPRIRGYGMLIAEQLATDLAYERHGEMNLWRVRFDLA